MLTILKLVLALALITIGLGHISQPSNTHVWIGLAETILGFALAGYTFYTFLKTID